MRLLCKLVLISFYRVGSYIGFNSNRYSDREEVLWCFAVDTDGGESDRPFLADCWTCNYELKNVDYEVRAGLSSVYDVPGKGWVADDIHSESASRTLDYACMMIFVVCFSSWAKSHSWQHQTTTTLPTFWLYTLGNLRISPTSYMQGPCGHLSWFTTMPQDSWKQGMRMGVGQGRITDGRKVCIMPELWTTTDYWFFAFCG